MVVNRIANENDCLPLRAAQLSPPSAPAQFALKCAPQTASAFLTQFSHRRRVVHAAYLVKEMTNILMRQESVDGVRFGG